jgi:hypothetical protein
MANDDKLWTQQNIQAIAKSAAREVMQSQGGLALPCQVIAINPNNPATGQPLGPSFVQVQFEVNVPYTKPDGTTGTYTLPPLILPKAEGQWVRSPTQVGDLGFTQAVDTFHGGVTGMSAGVADLGTSYGNMSSLVFVPIVNTNFAAPPDPNKAYVNGPAGAFVSDTAQTATSVVSENNITHTAGVGTANQVHTIYDGAGNAISHVVSSGGLIGVGVLASASTSAQAAYNKTHITSLMTNNQASRIQDLSTMAAAMLTAGVPNAAAVATALLALSSPPSILGIVAGVVPLPTIPSGSSIVRLP